MHYQTLYLVLFTALLIQTAALLLTWRQNPEELGLRDWGLSAALMTAGSLLVMLGLFFADGTVGPDVGTLPRLLRDAGSGLAGAAWLLALLGIRHFYHRPAPGYWLIPAFWLLLTALLWPGNALPGWRVALVSLTIVVCSALIIWELHRDPAERDLITAMGCIAMTVVLAAWLARGLSAAGDLQRASGATLIDRLCIYASIVMSITFTLSLILMTNQRIHRRLRDQASIDPLTGALNRRAFFEASRPLLGSLRRDAYSLAVCVVDIDHFKQVNDNHGHAVGDQVLTAFSRLAQQALREGDLFARYGGEEFVMLLQQGDPERAMQAIDRLRNTWAERRGEPDTDVPLPHVTFSAGISHASGPCAVTLEALLKAADGALYEAKGGGRNRSVVAAHSPCGAGVTSLPSPAHHG